MNSNPRDIIRSQNDKLPGPYPPTNYGTFMLYTAAVWTDPDKVPAMFLVGNGAKTTFNGMEYENVGLREGTQYGVFYYIRLQPDSGVAVVSLLLLCMYWSRILYAIVEPCIMNITSYCNM